SHCSTSALAAVDDSCVLFPQCVPNFDASKLVTWTKDD
ncbi:unnamed protein product, partial [Didymodactylos carnosus]